MPATGVCAPERMLVAVRAMAPVAGKPAEQRRNDVGDSLRRTARRSELCRSLLIRSATTADISDSIAPSMATVSAGREQARIRSGAELRELRNAAGRCGIPPKRVPMVSTGSLSRSPPTAVPDDKRDDRAGHALGQSIATDDQDRHRCRRPAASPSDEGVGSGGQSASCGARNSPGTLSTAVRRSL